MGVKKTMDTFFASMQEQSMSGYGGRLVNTPMGPFKWNETLELWENVNNGMIMNNISFNDLMMIGYETLSGESKSIPEEQFITGSLGVLTQINGEALASPNTDFWAAVNGAVVVLMNASAITFTKAVSIEFDRTDDNNNPSSMFYSKNGGAKTVYVTAISMGIGDTLKVGITTPNSGDGIGTGSIRIYDVATNTTIQTVPYFFDLG